MFETGPIAPASVLGDLLLIIWWPQVSLIHHPPGPHSQLPFCFPLSFFPFIVFSILLPYFPFFLLLLLPSPPLLIDCFFDYLQVISGRQSTSIPFYP